MRDPTKTNPAHGRHRGGALETVQAGSLNGLDDTTTLRRIQASTLARTLALLPDSAGAPAPLVYGEACR